MVLLRKERAESDGSQKSRTEGWVVKREDEVKVWIGNAERILLKTEGIPYIQSYLTACKGN